MSAPQYDPTHPAGQPEDTADAQALLDRLYRERFPGVRIRRTPQVTDDQEDPYGQA